MAASTIADDALVASLQRLNPEFVPGKSRKAFIFELEVGEEYLARQMHRELYFIEYASKHLALEHTALVPKGRFLTVAMIGKCIDEASLPARQLAARARFSHPAPDRAHLTRPRGGPHRLCLCSPNDRDHRQVPLRRPICHHRRRGRVAVEQRRPVLGPRDGEPAGADRAP